ncbi:MAG: N5-glutamine methyltransferase family protein [Candidatus Dormibacteria bacterium]
MQKIVKQVDPTEDAVRTTLARLAAAGCVLPGEEVAAALAAWDGSELTEILARLTEYAVRRERGEPPAYILGGTPFLGTWIKVGRGAFVPRPWTQAVARKAIDLLPPGGNAVDIGTGAGAVAAAIALASPASHLWATEIDPAAMTWARINLGALANVTLLQGDLFGPLPPDLEGAVDIVAGCLPYVPTAAVADLPRDFREHEPAVAFDGGSDGLGIVGRALAEATTWLRPGGWVVLEVGARQGARAIELSEAMGYVECVAARDEDGDDAMIIARR